VRLPSLGVEVCIPMRVVHNGINGSEVIFTLFYTTHMSEEIFLQDVRMVEQDLKNLKSYHRRGELILSGGNRGDI
jgi:hypothetical protein